MSAGYGVFENTDAAVMASKAAYDRFVSFTLRERGDLIKEIRLSLLNYANELAAMEWEETGMGICQDKYIQIVKAISQTPGASYITQDASSDEEGLLLQESFPFGVSCAIHPINHPVASIINNTLMLLAAGNSVINLIPQRACKVGSYVSGLINNIASQICGVDNLVICMSDSRYEYNMQLINNPDVSLVVVTGGTDIINKALSVSKRVIAAGCANPVVIIDDTADIRNAAYDIAESVSFDNNLLCTSEKCAVVLNAVHDELMQRLQEQGAYILSQEQQQQLQNTVFDSDMQIKRDILGQSADTILKKAGIISTSDKHIKLIAFDAQVISPFVIKEVSAPILPIVSVSDFEEALVLAKFIEQGYGHTASIFSKNIDHLSEASRELQTAIFIKNGSTLYGAGLKGDAPITFTIANVTGEGAVTPKCFVKKRKCILKGSFERK